MGDISIATPFTNGESNIDHTRLNSAFNDSTINSGSVTTAKIADLAVTGAKLAASAITSSKMAIKSIVGHRLTLESNVPVSTTDQGAKNTIYLTPYLHNEIALYTGSEWRVYELNQISIAVPNTSNTNYDVWCHYNSGTPALELLAWTNDLARATAITRTSGVYTKSGDATRRYMGTFRTSSASGQTEDTDTNRYMWNMYNRVPRRMSYSVASSWAYTSSIVRIANSNANALVRFVVGVSEDTVKATLLATGRRITVGFGLDSTTAFSANQVHGWNSDSTILTTLSAHYVETVAAGFHYLAWLEKGDTSGTYSAQERLGFLAEMER